MTERDPEIERVLIERDDLLDPIIARMARRLKRAMQDDQNLLLHRLRSDSGGYRQELLGSEDEQRRILVEASVDFLGDAFDAGEAFARKQLGTEGDVLSDATEINRSAVGSGAQELADTVVTLLRRRLLEEDADGPGPTEEEAAELISAAYREWRGERIERLVGDHIMGRVLEWGTGCRRQEPAALDRLGLRRGLCRLRRQRPRRAGERGGPVPDRPPVSPGARRLPVPGGADPGLTHHPT